MATPVYPQMEIHLNGGLCKIIEGEARRTYYASEESIGLALLGLRPERRSIQGEWVDFLATRGVAVGIMGENTSTMMVIPAKKRTLTYRRSDISREITMQTPALLITSNMKKNVLKNSGLYVIRPGFENKLTASLTEACLSSWCYGNVYDRGAICWGTTPTRDIHHPSEIEDTFFNSGFNGDLWHPAECGSSDGSLVLMMERIGSGNMLPPPQRYGRSPITIAQDMERV